MLEQDHVNQNRLFFLNKETLPDEGKIIYWMSREQRVDDNWGLIYALELAGGQRELEIIFTVSPVFSGHTKRAFDFSIAGLKNVEKRAAELGIKFRIIFGAKPSDLINEYAVIVKAAAVICDFNPLRESLAEHRFLAEKLSIPLIEVDSRNVIPVRFISQKQEYGAFTLRKKIEKVLELFLTPFPSIDSLPGIKKTGGSGVYEWNDWEVILAECRPSEGPEAVRNIEPGYEAGMKRAAYFLEKKFADYDEHRNNPNSNAQSGLSPYLHFGQISAQVAALMAAGVIGEVPLKGSFFDELIVRRELSDNFCLYNPDYDNFNGFPDWAKFSLQIHKGDGRKYNYSIEELEQGKTHDELWNAAQFQLISEGGIHGYMRMYWAKKILEWTSDASKAMSHAVYLNDRYSLDGHDSNGYAGCAWAIGGLHDRAWGEREIFGKVRYMNEQGCRRKFNVGEYIHKYSNADRT